MKVLSRFADLVAAIFILLTVAVASFTLLLIANPRSPLNPFPQPTPVPILVVPTDLPTWTPTNTPTQSPPSETPTVTRTGTATATPTATASPTASNTPVFGARATTPPAANGLPTATQAPPPVSRTGFQYVAGQVRYEPNKTSDGCRRSSIAGQIVSAAGSAVRGVAIAVTGGGGTIDETHYSGEERRFGEGGFEVFLAYQPREDDYTLTILGKTCAPLSEAVKVRTHASCSENVLVVTFTQLYP